MSITYDALAKREVNLEEKDAVFIINLPVVVLHYLKVILSIVHCLLQRVFRSPQMPNINPCSTYKINICFVCIIQFISAGANTAIVWYIVP